jgi:hypothetical protein
MTDDGWFFFSFLFLLSSRVRSWWAEKGAAMLGLLLFVKQCVACLFAWMDGVEKREQGE